MNRLTAFPGPFAVALLSTLPAPIGNAQVVTPTFELHGAASIEARTMDDGRASPACQRGRQGTGRP